MHIVTVVFVVRRENIAEFRALAEAHAAASLGEAGCRQFDVAVDPADPGRIMFYEVYDDEPTFLAHRETEHFKANAPRFAALASSRQRAAFDLISKTRPKR